MPGELPRPRYYSKPVLPKLPWGAALALSRFLFLPCSQGGSEAGTKPIDEEDRNAFARNLAWWLWTVRGGSGHFASANLPKDLFVGLARGETSNFDELKREYLSGAPLECKAGEVYFFAYRTFLEFLVAEHLAMHALDKMGHPSIAAAIREGVGGFLLEQGPRSNVRSWVHNLADARDMLPVDYLLFLASAMGGLSGLAASLQDDSPWNVLVRGIPILLEGASPEQLSDLIADSTPEGVLLVLSLLSQLRHEDERVLRRQASAADFFDAITPAVVSALLERTIGSTAETETDSQLDASIERSLLDLAQTAVTTGTRWGAAHHHRVVGRDGEGDRSNVRAAGHWRENAGGAAGREREGGLSQAQLRGGG